MTAIKESTLSGFKLEFEYQETDADFKALQELVRQLKKKRNAKRPV